MEKFSNTLALNDIQLRVFTDREWDNIINIGQVDTLDLPDPKVDVWRCPVVKDYISLRRVN